jgi:hypothetical protein
LIPYDIIKDKLLGGLMSISTLQNDHEVIDEGRKKTLDGEIPQVSLRDQIPAKLFKKLNKIKIGETVSHIWQIGTTNRMEWLESQRSLLNEFEEFLEPISEAPYSWSSTLHLPIAYTLCRTFHSRMNAAILSMDPPFTVVARKEANTDRAPLVQELMRYAFKDWANCYKGLDNVIDKWIWSWVTSGRGILKYKWEERFSRFIDVVEVQKQGPNRYEVDDQGNEVVIPTMEMVEEEQERVIPSFIGPWVESKQQEDVLIVGGDGDPDEADAVIEQMYLTASELWTLVDRGIFDEDAVKEVIDGGPDLLSSDQTGMIKQERAEINKEGQLDVSFDLDRYRVLECYMKKDVDGSGINSEIVCWVAPTRSKLLRATYLYRISKMGKRPFAVIDFHRRTNTQNPVGLVELTYSLCKEIDTQENMKIDFGLLTTLPFGFFRASSSMQAETMPLEPGAMIPLDNPQTDIYFPNLGNRSAFSSQEVGFLYSMVERMTSVSDLSLGVLGAQGAARTATGARVVASESNTNLDIYLKRMTRGFKKLLLGMFEMVQERMPKGLEFRILGEDGNQYFKIMQSKEEIAGMYDFELEGSSASSNKQIQMDNAQQIYQLTGNPMDIQLGIITSQERFEALKNYLQVMGVKNYSKFIRKPQGGNRLYTPEELANRTLAGIDVPLDPTQDLAGLIAYIDYIMADDLLLGQYNEQQAIQLAAKQREAKQLMAALEAQAAQTANIQQMKMNSVMSQDQAGAGGNMANPAPTSMG